ncbi:MAG: 50S ribosomal protein L4 [Candidatus Levybacteria bacterium RIFCSPLOWO2_01_FULL_36_13]|nr:MAG: 50S ribosomal protein L4 [Candidatus Levybacteria bacterium RIFCSPHIGHO2_01_FULL_36_15b]OGH35048.1 MAG: 50S ribosomal protein L4 [Candidatus Levybacteria bacterium RIFCSPLOWO2_01_FULL_36_13]
MSLPKEIFGVEENKSLLAQAVRVYLANQRSGTAKSKSRGEVNISTRKIYRQKGTGRARHGAASAPIFVGGGVAFGPRPHDFSLKLSKNLRRKALFMALSSKLAEGEIKIVSGFEKLEPKTKNMAQAFAKIEKEGKKRNLLLVTPDSTEKYVNVVKAARNIKGVEIMPSSLLNTYQVLKAKELLFMKEAINTLKESAAK